MPGPVVKENQPPTADPAGSTETKSPESANPTGTTVNTPTSQPAAGLPPRVDPVIPSSAEAAPIVSGGAGTAISTNDGKSVVMPTVSYTLPPVQGQRATDRGEDAEFVVLHTRFGRFIQGSRIARSDLHPDSDIPALIALGAIGVLGEDGGPLSPEAMNLLIQAAGKPPRKSVTK